MHLWFVLSVSETYRLILSHLQLVLDELDPSIRTNLVSRNWGPLCEFSHPLRTVLVREFYLNLSIYSENTSGHYLTS